MKFTFILHNPNAFLNKSEFEKTLIDVSTLGYDAIELQLSDATDVDVHSLKAILDSSGTVLSSFQTGGSYAKTGICFSSENEQKRTAAVEKMLRFIDLAAELNAIPVTGLLQGCKVDEPDETKAYDRIYTSLKKISAYAENRGVIVALEPCNKMEVGFNNTVARVSETIKTVGSKALYTMLDTYHANIEERSVRSALIECSPIMKHIHLSETNRSDFGTGHLDFIEVFDTLRELKFTGYCAIGVYFTNMNIITKASQALKYAKTALSLSEQKDVF